MRFKTNISPYRRLYFIFLILFIASELLSMQVVVHKGRGVVINNFENRIDFLVVLNEINSDTELSVIISEDSVSANWLKYSEHATESGNLSLLASPRFISNQSFITPDDHTGYILRLSGTVNGGHYSRELTVWVIDYSLYRPAIGAIVPETPVRGNCSQLTLTIDGNIPALRYLNRFGQHFTIKRQFKIEYETLNWTSSWVKQTISQDANIVSNQITINEPPLTDTRFTLTGDQFARELGLPVISVVSQIYSAIRPIAKISTEATIRTERHEGDRPSQISVLSGSAPLEIYFMANPNAPVANFFRWEILAENQLIVSRIDENHRYIFNKAGTFTVRLSAQNSWCTFTDSVIVKVTESAIHAPNVFTPNGDGINDEFRVAYRSIVEFKATIYNRWGVKIFEWTDPQRGWDGTNNGRPVPEGPYFYVIKARGADGEDYHLKGDINLLRGRKR